MTREDFERLVWEFSEIADTLSDNLDLSSKQERQELARVVGRLARKTGDDR
jgi:hypothetical protein